MKLQKIKFLPDQPLAGDKEREVHFGHIDIADSLRKIVLNCPLPFTIGLFGRWGSGKTTILNILRKKLQDDKVAVVNFDVWKHEGDPLRRAFLKELLRQLKGTTYLPKGFELSERLESSIQTTREIKKITWNWKVWSSLLISIAAIIGIGVSFYYRLPHAFGTYLSIIFGGSLISAIFIWVLQQMVISEMLTTGSERFRDPHEFEAEFGRIVKNTSSKKLLVIVDNLDRCTHSKAVELLSTIKTFLAKDTDTSKDNKCIFLIACDDEAIKKHLESVYKIKDGKSKMKPFSTDEFLRKFFNTFLRIPDFIDTELQTYTEDLLKQTGIPKFNSLDVAYVITAAYRENPRQIKQFINTLITHFLLAQERENSENPLITPKGAITNNVAFLAKFLMIHQQYLSEYQQMRESYLTVEEMENKGRKEFKNFLRATKAISVPDIRPFIYLKQSEEELTIPGIKELELGLIDNNQDIVKERLKVIKEKPEQIDSLKRFIPSLIERNKGRRIPLLNIVSCSLEAFQHHNLELNLDFYNKIADLFNDDAALKPELQRLKPSLIFKGVLIRCNKKDKDGIVAQYINILSKQKDEKEEPKITIDYACGLFKELLEHKDWLDEREKVNIRDTVAEVYSSSLKILSLFKDRIDDQKDFISEEAISKFASTFSNDDVENKQSINNKVELVLNFKEIITPPMVQSIVKKMDDLLKNENTKPYRDQKENLLSRIEEVLNTFHDQAKNIPDPKVLNTFADTVTQGMQALSDLTQKRIFVFTCLKLVDLLKDPAKSNINTLIRNLFNKAGIESIKFIFDKFDKKGKEELIEEYRGTFDQRVLQQQPIVDLLYFISQKDVRTRWFIKLINSVPERATQKLKELDYKVDDKKNVVGALLRKAQGATVQEKEILYEAINKMKCANDSELKSNLASQIKPLLKNVDPNQQKVGYDALQGAGYLSASVKREIARETIEWLRSLEPANAKQPSSIKSVILNWNILKSQLPVQKDYIDFIFDKLIKRGVNIDNIRLGFEMLFEIRPKYEDYSAYFDDALIRLESESNGQIKAELKSGLLKLKSPRLNEKNRDFWEKLEKLSSGG